MWPAKRPVGFLVNLYKQMENYTTHNSNTMRKIIECVPNYSEGRDRTVIDRIVAAISAASANGEKDKVLECIDALSGYDSNLEEVAKN